MTGIFRLSFPNGSPSAIVHARAPATNVEKVNLKVLFVSFILVSLSLCVVVVVSLNTNIHQPTTSAVPKHARQPDNDEVRVPPFRSVETVYNLGDGIVDPIHDAMGSASARHSTEYRAIRMSSVTNPETVIAVPIKK